MKMSEIKEKAKILNVSLGKLSKTHLIHRIQVAEGNNPCFGKSGGSCPYSDCCFMEDCLKIK